MVHEASSYRTDDTAAEWARAAKVWSGMEEQCTSGGEVTRPENLSTSDTVPYQFYSPARSSDLSVQGGSISYRTETSGFPMHNTTNIVSMPCTTGIVQMPSTASVVPMLSTPSTVQDQLQTAWTQPQQYTPYHFPMWPPANRHAEYPVLAPPPAAPARAPVWPHQPTPSPKQYPVFAPPPFTPARAPVWPRQPYPPQEPLKQYPLLTPPPITPVWPHQPNPVPQVPYKQHPVITPPPVNTDKCPVWPQKHTPCPVFACPKNNKTYASFEEFQDHWVQIHCPEKYLFECQICLERSYFFEGMNEHWKKHVGKVVPRGTAIKYKTITIKNGMYIDPKGVLPYRINSNAANETTPVKAVLLKYSERKEERVKKLIERKNTYSKTTANIDVLKRGDLSVSYVKKEITNKETGKTAYNVVKKAFKPVKMEPKVHTAKSKTVSNDDEHVNNKKSKASQSKEKPVATSKDKEGPLTTFVTINIPNDNNKTNNSSKSVTGKKDSVSREILKMDNNVSNTNTSDQNISAHRQDSKQAYEINNITDNKSNPASISKNKILKDKQGIPLDSEYFQNSSANISESESQKESTHKSKASEISVFKNTMEPETKITKEIRDTEIDIKKTDVRKIGKGSETSAKVDNIDENFNNDPDIRNTDTCFKESGKAGENIEVRKFENSSKTNIKIEKAVEISNKEAKVRNTNNSSETVIRVKNVTENSSTEAEDTNTRINSKTNIKIKNVDENSNADVKIKNPGILSKTSIKIENNDDNSNVEAKVRNTKISLRTNIKVEKDDGISNVETKIDNPGTSEGNTKIGNDNSCSPDAEIKLGCSEKLTSESDEEVQISCQPIWPGVPAPCPVDGCTKTGKFKKLNNFNLHWNKIHVEFSLFFECDYCNTKFESEKKADAHKKLRSHRDKEFSVKQIKIANKNFIDPSGILPYQSSSPAKKTSYPEVKVGRNSQEDSSMDQRISEVSKEANDIKEITGDQVPDSFPDLTADRNNIVRPLKIESNVDIEGPPILSPAPCDTDELLAINEKEVDSVQNSASVNQSKSEQTDTSEKALSFASDNVSVHEKLYPSNAVKREKQSEVEASSLEKPVTKNRSSDGQAPEFLSSRALTISVNKELEDLADKKITEVADFVDSSKKIKPDSKSAVGVDINESSIQVSTKTDSQDSDNQIFGQDNKVEKKTGVETNQIKAKPSGPVWPNVHAPCTVPACAKLGNFPSFSVFQTHWWLFHTRKPNKDYIDPGGHLPYKHTQELKPDMDHSSKAERTEKQPGDNKMEASCLGKRMTRKRKSSSKDQASELLNSKVPNSSVSKEVEAQTEQKCTEVAVDQDSSKKIKPESEFSVNLDINKSSNEESTETVFQKGPGPVWPERPTVCPVLDCYAKSESLFQFRKHWKQTHCPKPAFGCQICRTSYFDLEEAKIHKFSKHSLLSNNIIQRVTLPPAIHPKGVLPYREGNKFEKEIMKELMYVKKSENSAIRNKNDKEDKQAKDVLNVPDDKEVDKICENAEESVSKCPIWPDKPTLCPVPLCTHLGLFQTFEKFDEHFKTTHTSQINYQCKSCDVTFHDKKEAEDHFKLTHNIEIKGNGINRKFVVLHHNTKYINPKGIYPYHKGSVTGSLKIGSPSVSETMKSPKLLKKTETKTSSLKEYVAKKRERSLYNRTNQQETKLEKTAVEKDQPTAEPSVPTWPNVHAPCTVPACAKLGNFPSFSVFQTHWWLFHSRKSYKGFIDPGGYLPYKCRDKEKADSGSKTTQIAPVEEPDMPVWPVIPAFCPVRACRRHGKFIRFQRFQCHWKKIHVKNFLACKVCRQKVTTLNMKKHTHGGISIREMCLKMKELNKRFIDPKNIKPYQDNCSKQQLKKTGVKMFLSNIYKTSCGEGMESTTSVEEEHNTANKTDETVDTEIESMTSQPKTDKPTGTQLNKDAVSVVIKDMPVWPGIPALCPVPACAHLGKFTKFQKFQDHWWKVHVYEKEIVSCRVCKRRILGSNLKKHTHGGRFRIDEVRVKKKVINEGYIDPLNIKPYQNSKLQVGKTSALKSVKFLSKVSETPCDEGMESTISFQENTAKETDENTVVQEIENIPSHPKTLKPSETQSNKDAGSVVIKDNENIALDQMSDLPYVELQHNSPENGVKSGLKKTDFESSTELNTKESVKPVVYIEEMDKTSFQKADDSTESLSISIETEDTSKQEEKDNSESDWPVWPGVPTPCPVPACAGIGTFGSFDKFMLHWKKFHWDKRQYTACKFFKGRINSTNRKEHTHGGNFKIKDVLVKETEPNTLYIDPGKSRCFRKRKRGTEKPQTKVAKTKIDNNANMPSCPKKLKASTSVSSEPAQKAYEQNAENVSLDSKLCSEAASSDFVSKSKKGPIWPGVPAPCLVKTCFQKGSIFIDFPYFMNHWNTFHIEKILHCTCKICGLKLDMTDSLMYESMEVLKEESWIKHTSFNPHYIDTKGVKPYHEKSSEEEYYKTQLHTHKFDSPNTDSALHKNIEIVPSSENNETNNTDMKQNDAGSAIKRDNKISESPKSDTEKETDVDLNDNQVAENLAKSNKELKETDSGYDKRIDDQVLESSKTSNTELKGSSADPELKEDDPKPTWTPWPMTPTPCPVTRCRARTLFKEYSDFKEHWYKIHHKMITCYRCESDQCKLVFLSPVNLMKHKSIMHPYPGQYEKIRTFRVRNPHYIYPDSALPYVHGSPIERKQFLGDFERSKTDSITNDQTAGSISDEKKEKRSGGQPSPKPVGIKTVKFTNFRDARVYTFVEPFSGPCDGDGSQSVEAIGPFRIPTVIGISNVRNERTVEMKSTSIETAESISSNKESRPLWPLDPTECPVPACQKHGSFPTCVKFMAHWNKVHTEKKCFYQCVPCGVIFSDAEHTTSHRNTKTHDGEAFMTNQIIAPNLEFLDPKGILPYQFGTAEEREKMIKEKEKMDRAQDLLTSIRAKLEAIKSKTEKS